jgi:hypothetical protein
MAAVREVAKHRGGHESRVRNVQAVWNVDKRWGVEDGGDYEEAT